MARLGKQASLGFVDLVYSCTNWAWLARAGKVRLHTSLVAAGTAWMGQPKLEWARVVERGSAEPAGGWQSSLKSGTLGKVGPAQILEK